MKFHRTNASSSEIVEEISVRCDVESRGKWVEPVNETGFITTVLVYSDCQLKQRANRWKKTN
jgi:hypothetical protein